MSQPTEVPEILSVAEAAEVLRMHYVTACKMAKAGTLPGLLPRIGRNHRISRQLLTAYTCGAAS